MAAASSTLPEFPTDITDSMVYVRTVAKRLAAFTNSAREAIDLLGEPVEVIAAIGQRLQQKGSPYSAVFGALLALSGSRPRQGWLRELLAATPAEESLEALDREWEETAAFAPPREQQDCQNCTAQLGGLTGKAGRQGA